MSITLPRLRGLDWKQPQATKWKERVNDSVHNQVTTASSWSIFLTVVLVSMARPVMKTLCHTVPDRDSSYTCCVEVVKTHLCFVLVLPYFKEIAKVMQGPNRKPLQGKQFFSAFVLHVPENARFVDLWRSNGSVCGNKWDNVRGDPGVFIAKVPTCCLPVTDELLLKAITTQHLQSPLSLWDLQVNLWACGWNECCNQQRHKFFFSSGLKTTTSTPKTRLFAAFYLSVATGSGVLLILHL